MTRVNLIGGLNKCLELTPQAQERLSMLCRKLRGSKPLRKFTPQVGVSPSAWNGWENKKGNLGMDNAEKLASFCGTGVDQLLLYLNGQYSLEEYLRLSLPPEIAQPSSKSAELNTTVEQVLQWMNGLELPDLLRIVAKGAKLAEQSFSYSQDLNNQNKK
ncbi:MULTISPECIES: helix-turn-helix domain-containing protein [unclassified Coleofasciculus]|uniref:helix-turn-helix domain-containing protein n=1 Tax=unclassified Coleofasciculus TaxID=2692782 RepID=UPI00187E5EEE|nr:MULTISPECIES: helix-turn-helix transcriptional regulator [unclassified Coleofasciculus]MBE9124745.1 helix-turn-helix transcriptional regulator [Coleofasciculus sp. LEGE 07081]MBE9148197.1 helix-turn-helix transcriptional regulator [Coleofasciculus sp. LEGE 07092]